MAGYTKIFSSILDSTIWGLSKEARILWITMLVKKNRDQIVEAAIPGLANAARLTVPETEEALKELMAPDPYSRTKAHEGRRVKEVEGGWVICNGEKYRDMLSLEDRRAYKAAKQKEYRLRKKLIVHEGACAGAREAIRDGIEEAMNVGNGGPASGVSL